MQRLRLSENVAVFLLFFGIALIEAIQKGHWLVVLFWLTLGSLFLRADLLRANRIPAPASARLASCCHGLGTLYRESVRFRTF